MVKTARKKIILFSANPKYVGAPLSLLCITKLINLKKYEVKIITCSEYPNYEKEIIKECKGALCLGISVITGSPVKIAEKISKKVKEKFPKLPIIWGGWFPTTLPEEALKTPYVDYVCMGQGDKVFSQFVSAVASNNLSAIEKLPRLGYKKRGKVVLNERRGTENIQALPDFDINLIDWEKYLEVIDFGKRAIRITTSYGCPYRCAFCCEPMNSQRIWKALSASRVIKFLIKLRKIIDFDSLIIVDSNFFVDEKRVANICKGLIKNKFKVKLGQVNGRTNNLIRYKPQTWKIMKKAGLYNILIGAESGSERTLKFINKDATVHETLRLAKICRKYKILILASAIVGLPTKKYFTNSEKAFREDLSGVINLYRKICLDGSHHHLLVFPYTPLPFSPLYHPSKNLGYIPPSTIEEWSGYELTKVHVPWIPKSGYQKIDTLNYMSFVVGIDFKHFLGSLPPVARILIKPGVHIFKSVGRWRFEKKFLDLPLDMWLFYFCLRGFTAVNKKFRLINIGG